MTENILDELSIFEIRELARRTGVNSPTSKKKSELIKEILEINEGKREPFLPKTRQGRPPKKFGTVEHLTSVFIPENMGEIPTIDEQISNASIMNFAQDFDDNFDCSEVKIVDGYVELLTNGSAVLKSGINIEENVQDIVFIPLRLVGKYSLRAGDKIVCEASIASVSKPMIVCQIRTINNVDIQDVKAQRNDYSLIKHRIPNEKISTTSNATIMFGESVYLTGENSYQNSNVIINLLNSFSNCTSLYINVSVADKNKELLLKLTHSELFVSNIMSDNQTSTRIVALAINRAKRLLEAGQNVVIAIDDVKSIAGLDNEDLSLTKNLMSLTKSGDNGGSITIIAIMPKNEDSKINFMFEKLMDKQFKTNDLSFDN